MRRWESRAGATAWAVLGTIAIASAGGSGSSRSSEPARKVSMDDTEYETDPIVARSIPEDRARGTLKESLDSLVEIWSLRDVGLGDAEKWPETPSLTQRNQARRTHRHGGRKEAGSTRPVHCRESYCSVRG